MGSLYRSIEMCRCNLFLQTEVAYYTVAELGELGLTMFKDLNPDVNAFQRNYVKEVRRCDEMERQLRFIEKEIKLDQVDIFETNEIPDCPLPGEMGGLEATFFKIEVEIKEMNVNNQALQKNYTDLLEMKRILEVSDLFFPTVDQTRFHLQQNDADTGYENPDHIALDIDPSKEKAELNYVVGVIPTKKILPFETLLWRTTRGNIFLRLSEIEEPVYDPKTRECVQKTIFFAFFQGQHLKTRVHKIVEGFHASSYEIPDTQAKRQELYQRVTTQVQDLNIVTIK